MAAAMLFLGACGGRAPAPGTDSGAPPPRTDSGAPITEVYGSCARSADPTGCATCTEYVGSQYATESVLAGQRDRCTADGDEWSRLPCATDGATLRCALLDGTPLEAHTLFSSACDGAAEDCTESGGTPQSP